MPVCTINGCTVAPEHVDDLRQILVAYVADVRAHEPGCSLVRLHQEQGAENHFVVYAEFADQAAYDAHLQADHVAALRRALQPLMGDTHHKTILRPVE